MSHITDTISYQSETVGMGISENYDTLKYPDAIHIECYYSIRELSRSVWEQFASRRTVNLEYEHLLAVEESRINDLQPYYLIAYTGSEPIGIAYGISFRMDLARMANSYPPEVLNSIKTWKPKFMDLRVFEWGHIASLGRTIVAKQPSLAMFLQAFSKKLDEIASREQADLCIIRDITQEEYSDFSILKEHGFKLAMGFPIARMPLKWSCFDAYLSSLKHKKRYTIRQQQHRLKAPGISVELIENYAPYAERLAELWQNVAKRNNGYEHERLTPAFFEAMSKHLKGRSHVVAIKLHGTIVAFGLNLLGDEEYFGMAEGMDYTFRDRYSLYANNIYESLRVACELGKKSFNIGVTTYDFKTSIGAELDPSLYLVKAFGEPGYSNVYANFISKNIKQPDNQHRVFRDSDVSGRVQLRKARELLRDRDVRPDPFAKHYRYTRVDTVRSADLYTYCPVFESAQEPVIRHRGREVIMMGTNSYLGLATHNKVKEAACRAIDSYGSGCSGSPLLNGTLDLHNQLADQLAQFIQKEEALIYSTGYQANVGALSALVNRDDVLIMDERNHASLIDGARLSGAKLVRYKHNDLQALEKALEKHVHKPKLVVTDSLFSMEGTLVDLPQIVKLTGKYHARLMLDESHAIGVLGPGGRGVAEHFGLRDRVDIIMGTFSKSLASVGGFIAGERKIMDTLRHTSRSHIFSASLPPPAVAAVQAALEIIDEEPWRRESLLENTRLLAEGLKGLGYQTGAVGSAIIPVFCGHELLTVAAFHELFEEGVFVNPITCPAVPRNQEMLRVSLMATHSEKDILQALEIFKRVRTSSWPVRIA